jgi:lambda repressor-like predicted transcriptional regulator
MSGNSAIQGSTAKNASEISAIAIDLGGAEIWPGRRVVNGAKVSRNSSF